MTTVRAQCPACGDVQLQIDDLTVRVCSDDEHPGSYRFRCPGCDQTVTGGEPADRRPARVGRRARTRLWQLARRARRATAPARRSRPTTCSTCTSCSTDDRWFEQLVALVRRTTPE